MKTRGGNHLKVKEGQAVVVSEVTGDFKVSGTFVPVVIRLEENQPTRVPDAYARQLVVHPKITLLEGVKEAAPPKYMRAV